MKPIRWILSYMAGWLASLVGFLLAKLIFTHAEFGLSFFRSATGLAPMVFESALPTALFLIVGTMVAPSRQRFAAFIYFGLSLFCSCGHFSAFHFQEIGALPFWAAIETGVLVGGLVGLFFALKLQAWRANQPNKSPEPTPLLVTPPAEPGVAPSKGVAHL